MLKKWMEYKELLDSSHDYLTNDFPTWLANAEKNVPDTLDDAQKQREITQAELEKLYSMKQELQNSVRQCQSQNVGSTENLDKADEDVPSETAKFAEQVNSELNACVNQAEKRLDRLRDTIKKWDSVDRMRHDIRQWLKKKQQDLQDLESQPAKVHSEAAELDVERFKAFQDEVKAKGPAIEELQNYYKTLTQHNPSSVDPVIRAIQDDYEDLLGQLDIILHERQASMSQARALQAHQDTMDEDLENYARELERIEMAEATVVDRSQALQSALPQLLAPPHQRRRCRSTQTVSPRNGSGSDEDGDGPAHSPWKSPRGGPRGRGGGGGGATGGAAAAFPFPPSHLRGSRSGLPRSANTSRSNLRPRRSNRHNESQDLRNFKKGAAAAAAAANGAGLESESEESGYGDTFLETMHASSFDTHLDEPSYYYGSETQTPLTYIESDDESAASYVSGVFAPVDPNSLRDAGSQTPGHVRVQTDDPRDHNRSSMTQTENRGVAMYTSTTSLHSIGSQTKKKSSSRADLLKSILLEVKDIKKQQGIDDSETLSIASDITVSREMLEQVYRDVSALRAAGAHGNAETQTINEQGTQTAVKLFPEGDPQQQARQGKLNEMLEEIRQLKGGNQSTTPSNLQSTMPDFEQRTPSRSLNRTTPARFESPMVTPAPAPTTPAAMTNGHDHQQPDGRRRVTQDDLNHINDRLDRLANYQVPRRQLPQPPVAPPPPYPPQAMMPPPPPQQFPPQVMFAPPPPMPPPSPRRYRVREFSRSYDDMEAMSDDEDRGRRRGRRPSVDDGVRDRYHLDDALMEATIASRQLKRLSSKMKRNLRHELDNHRI